jgi:hypothetical protein
MKPFRPVFFAALSAFTFAASMPSPASACGDEWYPEFQVDPRIQGVDKAEEALDQGHVLAAAGSIVRMIPHIRDLSPTQSKLLERAHRVLAVATARYDGALPLGLEVPWKEVQGTWLGAKEADRQANLAWAVHALRELDKSRKGDPGARTELAEALAHVDASRAEARQILEELASKDLITSPDGYGALAKLREGAGDEAGRRAALERCRSMTHGAGVCEGRPDLDVAT